jgi:hypothetical protein
MAGRNGVGGKKGGATGRRRPTGTPVPKKGDIKAKRVGKRGAGTIRVGRTTMEIIEGKDDLSSWTNDDLIAGFKEGQKSPAIIPMEVYQELRRRVIQNARHRFTAELEYTLDKLFEIVKGIDTSDPTPAQMKAIEMVKDMVMGRPEEHVDVRITVPGWEKAMAAGIVSNAEQIPQLPEGEEEIVEGEVVEDAV